MKEEFKKIMDIEFPGVTEKVIASAVKGQNEPKEEKKHKHKHKHK